MGAGPIRWASIQSLYDSDLEVHCARVRAVGLDVSSDLFKQLFHELHSDAVFATVVQSIDWSGVTWREKDLSGSAFVHVLVPREYAHAVDEAHDRTAKMGIQDQRPEVLDHWRVSSTWFRSPVIVSGWPTGAAATYTLLVGCTRVGNLLGLMERGEVSPRVRHRIWVGSGVG